MTSQPSDLCLDSVEQGLVDVTAGISQGQYRRTDQAVRDRNHRLPARRQNELSLQAGWRVQEPANENAATHHDRAWQVDRPYGRKQVRQRC